MPTILYGKVLPLFGAEHIETRKRKKVLIKYIENRHPDKGKDFLLLQYTVYFNPVTIRVLEKNLFDAVSAYVDSVGFARPVRVGNF